MKCTDCGEELEFNSNDPCPNCGSIYKTGEVEVELPPLIASVKLSEVASEEKGRETNYPLFIFVLILTFGSCFLGFYISGFIGVIVGIIIGIITLYLGDKATTKTKNTERRIYEE